MRSTKRLIFCFCGMLATAGMSYGKDWHGIIPLRSTRADVERMLGPSVYGGGYGYETASERVFFTYSSGECHENETWDAPRDTVEMIIAYPKTKPLVSDLRLDPTTFKRTADCNLGSFHYTNEEEGLSYAVDGNLVSEIIYYPHPDDKRRVAHCRHVADAQQIVAPESRRVGMFRIKPGAAKVG